MWLHRILFNVRHRLLNRKSAVLSETHLALTSFPKSEERRARVIHNRIADLDARCAELQSK